MRHLYLTALLLAVPHLHAAPATELPAAVREAFDAYTHLPGTLVPLLEKVTSRESADTAAPKLQEKLSDVYTVREKLHKMPRVTPTQKQQIRLRYETRMRQEWGRMYAQIARLQEARCYQSPPFTEAFRLLCMMIEK